MATLELNQAGSQNSQENCLGKCDLELLPASSRTALTEVDEKWPLTWIVCPPPGVKCRVFFQVLPGARRVPIACLCQFVMLQSLVCRNTTKKIPRPEEALHKYKWQGEAGI